MWLAVRSGVLTARVHTPTGNLLKGGSSIKIDGKRVTQCYREMFSSRHISMRLADLMEDMMKRCVCNLLAVSVGWAAWPRE